jgi:hypothetical protein
MGVSATANNTLDPTSCCASFKALSVKREQASFFFDIFFVGVARLRGEVGPAGSERGHIGPESYRTI